MDYSKKKRLVPCKSGQRRLKSGPGKGHCKNIRSK